MGGTSSKNQDVEYNMLPSYVKEWEGQDADKQERIQDFHKSIKNRSTIRRTSSEVERYQEPYGGRQSRGGSFQTLVQDHTGSESV